MREGKVKAIAGRGIKRRGSFLVLDRSVHRSAVKADAVDRSAGKGRHAHSGNERGELGFPRRNDAPSWKRTPSIGKFSCERIMPRTYARPASLGSYSSAMVSTIYELGEEAGGAGWGGRRRRVTGSGHDRFRHSPAIRAQSHPLTFPAEIATDSLCISSANTKGA